MLAGMLQAEQYGNMIFTPPPGWTRVPQPDSLAFVPGTRTARDKVMLVLLQDRELSGDFRNAFASLVRSRIKKNERVLQHTPPSPFRNSTNAEGLFQILIVRDSAGHETARNFLGFHVGNRIDVITLDASNRDVFVQNQPIFKEFVSHLQFTEVAPDQSEPNHGTRKSSEQEAAPHAETANHPESRLK